MNFPTGSAAILGRWQPVHLGHQAALQSLCERFERVTIGIGSSNVTDYRSPFALDHIRAMLHLALDGFSNYRIIPIPDDPDDAAWQQSVRIAFSQPDVLFTANPWVAHLLEDTFPLAHPAAAIPPGRRVKVSGTMVRRALARGAEWQQLLPPPVADYLAAHGLEKTFRARFGLHTLAMETVVVA